MSSAALCSCSPRNGCNQVGPRRSAFIRLFSGSRGSLFRPASKKNRSSLANSVVQPSPLAVAKSPPPTPYPRSGDSSPAPVRKVTTLKVEDDEDSEDVAPVRPTADDEARSKPPAAPAADEEMLARPSGGLARKSFKPSNPAPAPKLGQQQQQQQLASFAALGASRRRHTSVATTILSGSNVAVITVGGPGIASIGVQGGSEVSSVVPGGDSWTRENPLAHSASRY